MAVAKWLLYIIGIILVLMGILGYLGIRSRLSRTRHGTLPLK